MSMNVLYIPIVVCTDRYPRSRAASDGDPAPYPYSSSRATMVNFGKYIKNQTKPEWEPYYLNYNGLKELIKVRS